MGRPDKSMMRTELRDGLIGAFLYWLGGFEIEDGLTADLSEREMRRIRAKQIDAVTLPAAGFDATAATRARQAKR